MLHHSPTASVSLQRIWSVVMPGGSAFPRVLREFFALWGRLLFWFCPRSHSGKFLFRWYCVPSNLLDHVCRIETGRMYTGGSKSGNGVGWAVGRVWSRLTPVFSIRGRVNRHPSRGRERYLRCLLSEMWRKNWPMNQENCSLLNCFSPQPLRFEGVKIYRGEFCHLKIFTISCHFFYLSVIGNDEVKALRLINPFP